MNRRPYYRASIASFLLLIVSATLLFSIDSLRLGEGFGREVNMIVNHPPETHVLHDFLDELRDTPIEVYAYPMSGNRTLIKLVGVNDMQQFLEGFGSELQDVYIETVGTFGTLASIASNIKLFQIYFVVFLLGYVMYAAYRYQRTGFAISLSIVTVLVFTLFITNVMGFLLNNTVWMALLLSFVFMLMQKYYIVNALTNFLKQEPEDYNLSVNEVLNSSLYFSLIMSIFGLILIVFGQVYINAAVVFLIISIWLVIERFALLRFLPTLMQLIVKDEDFRETFLPRDSLFRATPVFNNLMIRGFLVGSLFVVVLSGSSLVFTEAKELPTHTNHILIVQDTSPATFLEVQASLHKYGLQDKLVSYRVSEEKATWFKFEGLSNRHTLDAIKADLQKKTLLESAVYSYVDEVAVAPMMRYGSVIVSVLSLFGLHLIYKDKKQRYTYFGLSLLTTVTFALVAYFLGVSGESLSTLALWITPFLTTAALYYYHNSNHIGSDLLKNILSVLGILILPMIVIIPLSNNAAHLQIRIFVAYAFALGTTVLLLVSSQKE